MRKRSELSVEVTNKLVPMLAAGTGQREIAKLMNEAGYTTPSGMLWSQSFVSQYGKRLGYRRVAKFKKGKKGRRYIVKAHGEPTAFASEVAPSESVDPLTLAKFIMGAKGIPANYRTHILELVLR